MTATSQPPHAEHGERAGAGLELLGVARQYLDHIAAAHREAFLSVDDGPFPFGDGEDGLRVVAGGRLESLAVLEAQQHGCEALAYAERARNRTGLGEASGLERTVQWHGAASGSLGAGAVKLAGAAPSRLSVSERRRRI
jgi:hypothetical protein